MLHRSGLSVGAGRGFSLAELLVVVSIIALLMAIALPVINRSRSVGAVAMSANSMRMIGTASLSYATEEQLNIPPMQTAVIKTGYERTYDVGTAFGWTGRVDSDYLGFGDILAGAKMLDGRPVRAPGDQVGVTPTGRNDDLKAMSYAPNHFFYMQHRPMWGGAQDFWGSTGSMADFNQGNQGDKAKSYGPLVSEIVTPSETILIAEPRRFGNKPTNATVSWGHWDPQTKAGALDIHRYDGKFAISFVDNHVETLTASGYFGVSDPSATLASWADAQLNWTSGVNSVPVADADDGTVDGISDGDAVSVKYPHWAGWRSQPYDNHN